MENCGINMLHKTVYIIVWNWFTLVFKYLLHDFLCIANVNLQSFFSVIILCYRKRPEVKEKEKKEKLQERLNSLSFYDSIPMYESIGRRGGVARAPKPQDQKASKTKGNAKSNSKKDEGENKESLYWTNIQVSKEHDSDHDSAIYAELDKHSAGEGSQSGTPPTLPKQPKQPQKKRPAPPPPPQTKQHSQVNGGTGKRKKNTSGDKHNTGLALDLSGEESEAVYTHVWGIQR